MWYEAYEMFLDVEVVCVVRERSVSRELLMGCGEELDGVCFGDKLVGGYRILEYGSGRLGGL
jgi:hypothetical protein